MIQYALLGLLQGLTEFLPVSSSGHLVLARVLLGVETPGVSLEAAVHLGTLASVLLYFRSDLRALAAGLVRGGGERRAVGHLVLATLPVAVVGLLARGAIERTFGTTAVVGAMLLVTAAVLALGSWRARRSRREEVGAGDALSIGLAQAASLLPGISRSGSTVATGIGRGLTPTAAARFSFLAAIPAIGGASGFALLDVAQDPRLDGLGLAIAAVCAFLSGLAAVHLFLRILRRGTLWPFAVYCALIGAAVLVLGQAAP